MAQLVVRNIESIVKSRLQLRARRNGRSMEEEIRDILRSAAVEEPVCSGGLGKEISALFSEVGFDEDIRELRGQTISPIDFES
jgi:antitoxin FitA